MRDDLANEQRIYALAEKTARDWSADLDAVSLSIKIVDVVGPVSAATELRRCARHTNDTSVQIWLRARADELDPDGGDR